MNKLSTLKIFKNIYFLIGYVHSVIEEYEYENFKFSMRVIFKKNFDKISTLTKFQNYFHTILLVYTIPINKYFI